LYKLLKILVILVELYLSACSPQLPASPPPSITGGPLDSAQAYLMRGDQYSGIKDFEHAIADYGQAIQLKPDYAEAYNNRGFAYSIFGKVDMPKAIADFSEAIRLRPAYAYAYNNRGVAYMASGYPDQALSDFNRAIQLQPDFPQAYSNRGNAYLRLGHIFLAVEDFSRAGKNPITLIFIPVCIILVLFFFGVRTLVRAIQRRLAARGYTP
jgi:lipoprotein NlpI